MPSQHKVVEAQLDKKNEHKIKPAILPQEASKLAGITELTGGLLGTNADGKLQSQAERLGNVRQQTAQRQAIAGRIGQIQGNSHLQRAIAQINLQPEIDHTGFPFVQLKPKKGQGKEGGGSSGPGSMQNSQERTYDVTGNTLDQLLPQLAPFDGYPAETYNVITIQGRVRPQRQSDGTYQVRVQWIIQGTYTTLPRWTDYNSACPAAQQEWNRFMTQVRAHEQQAHVNAALDFVSQLGEADTLITGASVAEVTANLQSKQQDLGRRLQAIHDGCTHGTDIDAILHAERGVCR